MKYKISVILTGYSDNFFDFVLRDIKNSSFDPKKHELLIVEAGNYSEKRARSILQEKSKSLKFIIKKNISRTAALNLLVSMSKADLVIRLDARSKIGKDYFEKLIKLSSDSKAANIGGVMVPIGLNLMQKNIAKFMLHPFALGGGKSRDSNYTGIADSLYLGAFNKKLMPAQPWFDETFPQISEDSDLNHKIRSQGGRVFIDSSIKVQYYARESLVSFFRLCHNYGIGRGIFVLKNKKITALRQFILPIAFLGEVTLLIFTLTRPEIFKPFFYLSLSVYVVIILLSAIKMSKSIREILVYVILFLGTHFFWVLGFFQGIKIYFDKYKK
jgi:succinoglycan biosynthesis protein ExoA